MTIYIKGDANVGMPQPFAYYFSVYASFKQEGGMTMPKVMKTDMKQPS